MSEKLRVKEYQATLDRAFELDASMYRVRSEYRKKINAISKDFPEIFYLDMGDHFESSDFIDHCHLLPKGQVRLAKLIQEYYSEIIIENGQPLKIINNLTNPEYYLGNKKTFPQYFKIDPISSPDITKKEGFLRNWSNGENIKAKSNESISNDDFDQGMRILKKHPCFMQEQYIEACFDQKLLNKNRFPEFLIARFMISVLEKGIIYKKIADKIYKYDELILTTEKYNKILVVSSDREKIAFPNASRVWFSAWRKSMLSNVKNALLDHLGCGSQIQNRLKSTIFWYFRETLRFGSHSRISMRYDRTVLEYCSEALLVVFLIDELTGVGHNPIGTRLLDIVWRIVQTHERYCSLFILGSNDNTVIREYNLELKSLASEIKHGK